jgi:serine protease Do
MVTTIGPLADAFPGLADETATLVQRLRSSVVIVRDGGRGSGSGVIWQPDGVIVTNHHVTPGTHAQVELTDGRQFQASVRRSDPEHDLAMLQVPALGLPAARIGDSSRLRAGELVFAVGNPLGLSGAVTAGIISAPPGDGVRVPNMVRADVSLAPGNSGGLLATADGSVVGINSMMRMPGLALAVPSNVVSSFLSASDAERGYLGVTLLETELPTAWQTPQTGDAGFIVTGVAAGSPAERAGVLIGDVIIGTNGDALGPPSSLPQALGALQPDESIELLVLRGGQARTISVLAGRPAAEAA